MSTHIDTNTQNISTNATPDISSVDTNANNIAVFKLRGVTQEWTTYSCVINPAKPGLVVFFFSVPDL